MAHDVERVGDQYVVTKIEGGRKLYLCSLTRRGVIQKMTRNLAEVTAAAVHRSPDTRDEWVEWPSSTLPMKPVNRFGGATAPQTAASYRPVHQGYPG